MASLTAKSPCAGLLPLEIGSVRVTEVEPQAMASLQPFKGQDAAVDKLLQKDHGVGLPSSGKSAGKAGQRVIWFGKDIHMCVGFHPSDKMSKIASVSDQSDAWAVVELSGEGAEAVLSRLVPVDLRGKTFKRGHTCRTLLEHLQVSLTRIGENAFQIMVFRSMAHTLVHELERAMAHVAARSGNSGA